MQAGFGLSSPCPDSPHGSTAGAGPGLSSGLVRGMLAQEDTCISTPQGYSHISIPYESWGGLGDRRNPGSRAAGAVGWADVRSGMTVFETKRLVVRTPTAADVDVFYGLWTDPRVMANVGFPQGLRITRGEIEERILKQDESAFEALLVVALKTTGQAIGECHMHRPDTEGIAVPDVKLLPAFWGNKHRLCGCPRYPKHCQHCLHQDAGGGWCGENRRGRVRVSGIDAGLHCAGPSPHLPRVPGGLAARQGAWFRRRPAPA